MKVLSLLLIFYIIGLTISLTTLEWEEHQTSVLLKWNSTETPEYILVLRQKKNTSEWKSIAKLNPTEKEFEDKTTYPIFEYYYKISLIKNGININSNVVLAHCVQTCTIVGSVLEDFKKGIPGVEVVVELSEKSPLNFHKTVKTDKNGNFKIEGLPYFKRSYINYAVFPILPEGYNYSPYERVMHAYFSSDNNYIRLSSFCFYPKRKLI